MLRESPARKVFRRNQSMDDGLVIPDEMILGQSV
jgi:hypothetical protein